MRCLGAGLRSCRSGGQSAIRSRVFRSRFATRAASRPRISWSRSAAIRTGSARPTRSNTIRSTAGTGSRACGATRRWCSRSMIRSRTGAPAGPRIRPSTIRSRPLARGRARASKSAPSHFSAPPDGYQIGIGVTGTHAQNQSLYKKPLYDAATDFAPVGLIADASYILITRTDFPAANLRDFSGYAKVHQSTMQFGSAGAGSGTHVTCLLLNSSMGIEVTHVPYRTTALAMPDLLAGRIDYICEPVQTALPLIEQKTVKAIATLTRDRSAVLPDLPTAHEQGVADFDA